MRNLFLTLMIAASTVIGGSSPALAEPFAGPHVEAILGWTSGDQAADPLADKHDAGLLYGGSAGYDLRFGRLVIGALGEISDSTGHGCAQINEPAGPAGSNFPGAAGRSCRHEGRTLFAGARLGYVVGKRSLLYVSGGYVNARKASSFDGTLGGEPLHVSGHESLDGLRVGGGIERAIAEHVFVKAEYRYTAAGYHLRADQHQLATGIGFRF